ncbi:tripartite tricarboxylate transporter permease [Halovenus halobia]|uniref:tripartite tricarboxylate transporter permease n=1 Tax=Halovenus halobia TaxID=3396622 RepID=UPI003F55E57B
MVEFVFTPETTLTVLAFLFAGVALGTCSGLVPGLHANNFALLLAGFAPAIPAQPLYVGVAMLAAGVVHTFLDIVPALALGVPDPTMAPTALPGHRLVLEGRGREALRLSALGSLLAVGFAIPLALPVTKGMGWLYPLVVANLSVVLGGVCFLLIMTERTTRARLGAALVVGASGALGVLTLDVPTGGLLPAGSMLAPLFAGLFGAPVLIEAIGGAGVPEQADPAVTTTRRFILAAGLLGTLSGAVVGYLPGISSAIAAAAALAVLPAYGPRAFVITSSGVNTANTVFALFALVSLGQPRTGVLVALERTQVPLRLPVLLCTVAVAAGAGFLLVLALGDRYLAAVGSVNTTVLSLSVLGLLCVLVFGFTGLVGVGVFAVATLVGLLPARFGTRRMTCMGVLLVPLAL